jgi:hypothetical protein
MKSASLFALTLSLVGTAMGQDLTRKVNYTTVAVPIRTALADISKQSNVSLDVEGYLQNEPVILRVNDATVGDTMKHIAAAMNAEWRPVKGGFELYRSQELTDKLQKSALDTRANVIRECIEKKLAEQSKLPPFTPSSARSIATSWARLAIAGLRQSTEEDNNLRAILDPQMPDRRAIWRVLSAVDPHLLARVQTDSQITFSTRPSAAQVQLPESILEAASTWQEDHNLLANEIDTALGGAAVHDWVNDEGDVFASMPQQPSRLDLSVLKYGSIHTLSITLMAFDQQGSPLVAISAQLSLSSSEAVSAPQKAYADDLKKGAPGDPIALSPMSQQLTDHEKDITRRGSKEISKELRDCLLHPEQHEPLSMVVSDALLDDAQLENRNLVANVDDSLAGSLLFAASQGNLKTGVLRDIIRGSVAANDGAIAEPDAWMEISSTDPESMMARRIDRSVLGDYLRAREDKGYVSIADAGHLASAVKIHSVPAVASLQMFLLWPSSEMPFGYDTIDLLKLYDSLDPQQLDRMAQGNPISVAELRADQRAALESLVYQTRDLTPDNSPVIPGKPWLTEQTVRHEPTERFPDGVPTAATILFTPDVKDGFLLQSLMYGSPYTRAASINDVASSIARTQSPDPRNPNPEVIQTICPTKDRVINFKLTAPDEYMRTGHLEEVARDGKPAPLNELPADLKAKIDALVKQYIFSMSQEPAPVNNKPPG